MKICFRPQKQRQTSTRKQSFLFTSLATLIYGPSRSVIVEPSQFSSLLCSYFSHLPPGLALHSKISFQLICNFSFLFGFLFYASHSIPRFTGELNFSESQLIRETTFGLPRELLIKFDDGSRPTSSNYD
jgi:hypothetical protein